MKRRIITLVLVAALALTMVPGQVLADGEYSLDMADYADRWAYNEVLEKVASQTGEPTGETVDLKFYSIEGVVYCENPVDAELQVLNIYVPEAYMRQNEDGGIEIDPEGEFITTDGEGNEVTYTAATAPMIYYNTVNGYAQGNPTSIGITRMGNEMHEFIENGFIYVGAGARGRDTQDEDGNTIGYAPEGLVDLKAGIRFLRLNDSLIPGSAERIVSVGVSAGGAMSSLLGATGNSTNYDPYFAEIGAADARDDIYAAICYCPITSLDIGDAAFEWGHNANANWRSFGGQDGVLNELEQALATELYYDYVDYVQGYGLDLGDDGRSGTFYTEYVAMFEEALETYVDLYYADEDAAELAQYIADLDPDGEWLTWDEDTRTAEISWDDYNRVAWMRRKGSPGFDTLDRSAVENAVFGDETADAKHFSASVRDSLGRVIEDNPDADYALEAQAYYGEYVDDVDEEMEYRAKLMSPMAYVGTDEQSDKAPFWRFRIGSQDPDLGAVSGYTLGKALEQYEDGVTVDTAIVWGQDHTSAEYSFDDVMNYIHDVAAQTDFEEPEDPEDPVLRNTPFIEGYGDGTFGGRDLITRAEVAAMVYRVMIGAEPDESYESPFDDVNESTWFHDYVTYLAKYGVVEGYPDSDNFEPDEPITREEFVKIICEYADLEPTEGPSPFYDVDDDSWAVGYILSAANAGWVEGDEMPNPDDEVTFRPGDGITRGEAVKVINRTLGRYNRSRHP